MKEEFIVKPLKNKKCLTSAFPNLFKNPYNNTILIGATCSGKTTNAYRIIEQVVKKGMNVVIFSGSLYSDDMYKEILALLKRKQANVIAFDHFMDFKNGVCRLEEIIKEIEESNLEKEQIEEEKQEPQLINFGDKPKPVKKKPKKKREKTTNLSPETLIIIDDLSSDMHKQDIMYKCLNRNRHNKIMALILSHSFVDLTPKTYLQASYMLLYPQLPYDKVIELQDKIGLSSNLSTKKDNLLLRKYKEATQEGKSKYDFLYIDKKDNSFKRNYNEPL